MAGTPRYMAPESYRDEKCTEKIDIYSLAMMIWEMLTGQLPWDGSNFQVLYMFGGVGCGLWVWVGVGVGVGVGVYACITHTHTHAYHFRELLWRARANWRAHANKTWEARPRFSSG